MVPAGRKQVVQTATKTVVLAENIAIRIQESLNSKTLHIIKCCIRETLFLCSKWEVCFKNILQRDNVSLQRRMEGVSNMVTIFGCWVSNTCKPAIITINKAIIGRLVHCISCSLVVNYAFISP